MNLGKPDGNVVRALNTLWRLKRQMHNRCSDFVFLEQQYNLLGSVKCA